MKGNKESDHPHYGFYIQRLSKKIKYLADENLAKQNITLEQVKIIRYLAHQSENTVVHQKDIETEFGIKRSSVTNILQNIEKNGWITREGDISDARVKKVILTETGRNLSQSLKGFMENLEAIIVDGMTAEEKELYLKLITKSLNNLGEIL